MPANRSHDTFETKAAILLLFCITYFIKGEDIIIGTTM